MRTTKAYAASEPNAALAPFEIQRREPGPEDVLIDILYCGVCHTDIHMARGEMPGSIFPMVPGHEMVGKVAAVGNAVTRFKIGDTVAVGCIVDSCRECRECKDHQETYCDSMVLTYNAYERDGKTITYGGYSSQITVDEHYLFSVPPGLDLAGTAPLLCAGITPYAAYRHWNIGKGSQVGVIGLGGVGHLAVKIAVAMGAEVTVFSSSESKRADAARLGAQHYANSRDPGTFKDLAGRFDMILNTVSAELDNDAYISLLRRDGAFVMVAPGAPITINTFPLVMKRRNITGVAAGGSKETQEMLNFCAEHNISAEIELISIDRVNEAFERILRGDVRYRFVIDMATL